MTKLYRDTSDFAEAVTIVLASVAANAGSTDSLISGRPGSWESAHLSQMLASTVGFDDSRLMPYRTEPLTVRINVDETLRDLGVLSPWEYEDQLTTTLDGLGTTSKSPDAGTVFIPNDPETYEAKLQELEQQVDAYERKYQAEAEAFFQQFEANIRTVASSNAFATRFGDLPSHISIGADMIADNEASQHGRLHKQGLLEELLSAAVIEKTAVPVNLKKRT